MLALGEIRFQRGVPRNAVAPTAELLLRSAPVLVYGELTASVELDLAKAGVPIIRAPSPEEAIQMLSVTDFRAVAIYPNAPGAIELVKAVKMEPAGTDPVDDTLWEAASRHLATPFVILPLLGDTEYAVIVAPPYGAFLERAENFPIIDALLRLDTRTMLPRNLR